MDEKELERMDEMKPGDEFVFMREEIKSRPINRKKLARNTFLAAISAVVFGLVACVTFALLAPYVTDFLSEKPVEEEEENPILISIPEETVEEEMAPEDMLVSTEEEEIDYSELALLEEEEIKKIVDSVKMTASDYQDMYKALADIANDAKKGIVRVTPIKQNTNWLNNIYEKTSDLSGLIVAETDTDLYILTNYSLVKDVEEIVISFVNSIQAKAAFVDCDTATDLCILSVSLGDINEVTLDSIEVASLGSSMYTNLVGTPCIAVGSPLGTYGSLNYGMVTSNSGKITVTDNCYKQVITNIYGTTNANGIIISLKGDVIGIIDNKYSSSETKNLVTAIGISELRKTLERMINKVDVAYLGIKGSEVPIEATVAGAPEGVIVSSVELDSPALNAGIQSGDIITNIGGNNIYKFSDFVNALKGIPIDSEQEVMIYRYSQGSYKKITSEVHFDRINK